MLQMVDYYGPLSLFEEKVWKQQFKSRICLK